MVDVDGEEFAAGGQAGGELGGEFGGAAVAVLRRLAAVLCHKVAVGVAGRRVVGVAVPPLWWKDALRAGSAVR